MGIFDITLEEMSTKAFTITFVVIMAAIGAFNIWLLIQFRELQFTPETKKSHSHTVVEALLWTLSILPLVIAVAVIGLLISKKSERYKIPLIGLIASLLIYSILQLIISFYWKNLDVVNRNSPAFMYLSDAILFSGYLTLPVVLIIVGIWWFIAERSPKWQKEKLKEKISETSQKEKEAQKQLQEIQKEKEMHIKKLSGSSKKVQTKEEKFGGIKGYKGRKQFKLPFLFEEEEEE